MLIRAVVVTVFIVAAIGFVIFSYQASYIGIRAGRPDADYIKSTDCRLCHQDHFESWSRTHHSRMTQNASAATVQGDFKENNSLEYLGVKTRMETRDGSFVMKFAYPDGQSETHLIERTIGSRRIEQYIAKQGSQYFRLPIAYDLMNSRWISLNGSFFYPDGGDFKQHLAQWDTNCVFCHNVKAQPNYNFETRQAKTEVSELGIACGACHAQGAEHAELAASPFRRAIWRFSDNDKRIIDPLRLDSDRSMMVCGHCHGQRVPQPEDRIREVLGKGDPFDAGGDLSQYYKPVHADTRIGNFSFANRFWPDGSPRLTAYEYQGIIGSACFVKGQQGRRITCTSCHTMHEGDVKGQLTDDKRKNAACTQCHAELQDNLALKNHSKHEPTSNGSSCYSCHMPEVVYGVQAIHKTHLITVPDPTLTAQKSVPNACSQCHVDKSVNWAIINVKALWPERFKDADLSTDAQFDMPESVRGLFAGDALMRSLMADAMTRRGELGWAEPYLIEAFNSDNYPIVRYFAANGLASARSTPAKPDYLADANVRSLQIYKWIETIDAERIRQTRELASRLRAGRKDVDIEVGE